MDLATIERFGLYEDGWFRGRHPSDLFGHPVSIKILLDDGQTRLTPKQVATVNDFLKLDVSALSCIKEQLFKNCNCYGLDERTCTGEINSAEDAWGKSRFNSLLIWYSNKWHRRCANLCFDVDWDIEHGTSVVMIDGQLRETADIQDYYRNYDRRIDGGA